MSSGTIDVIDQLTKNLNNHKAIKELIGGTGNIRHENCRNDSSKTPIRATKKHFEPARIIESNKKFKHSTVTKLNRVQEKEKFKRGTTIMEMSSQGSSKQLSFFHSDDEDASNGCSNSPKRATNSSCQQVEEEEEIILIHDDDEGDCASKDSDVKVIESHQDDVSSTGSCSCEDHSSVASPGPDPHVDLDYDDDSIHGSPCEVRNGNSNPTKISPSSQLSAATPQRVDSNISALTSDNNNSGAGRSSQSNELALSEGEQVDDDSEEEESEPRKGSKSRIKSFINYNHDENESRQEKLDVISPDNRSTKSYSSLLKYFFKDTCYFQIKSINHENVELSKSMGVWSTPIQNELRLNAAFREHRNVILIFSVQQSGAFQGFARMVSEARPSSRPIPWILPERLSNKSLGGVMKLEWLCTKELQFHDTLHLLNDYNDNKPVKIARDGQQVEPKVAKRLCKLFPEDDRNRILDCITTLKRQTSQRKKTSTRYDGYYPFMDRHGYVPIPYNGRFRHDFPPGYQPLPPHYMCSNDFFVGCDPHSLPMEGHMDIGNDNNTTSIMRDSGRDRDFNHSNHQGFYIRQDPVGPNNFPGHLRHQYHPHVQRRPSFGLPTRYIMPYNEGDTQPIPESTDIQKHPSNTHHHHHTSPPVMWSNSNSPSRYHPYQRSRR